MGKLLNAFNKSKDNCQTHTNDNHRSEPMIILTSLFIRRLEVECPLEEEGDDHVIENEEKNEDYGLNYNMHALNNHINNDKP